MKRLVGRTRDNYRLDEFLGQSPRGATFRAYDLEMKREVAVKFLDPKFAAQPELESAFREWQAVVARLDQPDLVKIYETKVSEAGVPTSIVMKIMPRGNLRRRWADLGLAEALEIIRQVCLILDFTHGRQIFHRTLKPENILLGEPTERTTLPKPYLADLGLPAWTDLGSGKMLFLEPSTQVSVLQRTLQYIAPEQARDGQVDARTDIYSLGILLYELVSGQPPFEVETIAQAKHQHTEVAPRPPSSLNPSLPQILESIILKALAKEPTERYQSAAALAEALGDMPAGILASTKNAKRSRRSTPATKKPANMPSRPTIIGSGSPPSPPPPPSPAIITPSNSDPFRVEYDVQGFLRVHPGNSCSFDFTIANQTQQDLEIYLTVEGISSSWVSNLPTQLILTSQRPQTIQFKLTPPRSPKSRAGQYPFKVRVHSPAFADFKVTISKPLIVETYKDFSCELLPSKAPIKFGSANRLMVRNQGNAAETFLIRWHEPLGKIRFRPNRVRTQIPAGDHKTFSFEALPTQLLRIGATPLIQDREKRPVSIIVSSGDKTDTIQHEVISRGLIPTRYGLFFVIFIFLINLICFVGRFIISGPTIENVVLNPPEPKLNQPFSVSWIIEGNRWGASVDLLLESQKIKTDLGVDDEYYFMSGINRPHTLTVQVANLWGLTDARDVQLGLPPPLVDIDISPLSVPQGETVLIEWRVQNASSVSLTDSSGRSLLSDPERFIGTLQDQPPQSVTYTLTARTLSNPPQTAEKQISVEVRKRLRPLTKLMVEPQVIEIGQDPVITLTWVVDNAEMARIEPEIGIITPCTPNVDAGCVNQQRIRAPDKDTTYTLVARNSAYSSTSTVQVLVLEGDDPVISQFEIEPSIITRGVDEKINIVWKTDLAEIITIEPDIGVVGPFGSREVDAPSSDTVYSLTAQNGQRIVEKTVNVKVREAEPPEIVFTAAPDTLIIREGEASREPTLPVTLEWDVTNVDNGDQVVITRGGDVIASGILSGSTIDKIPAIPGPVTYFLTARNRFRQTTVAEYTVFVDQQ